MKWDGKSIKNLRRKMSWSPIDLARRLNCHHRVVLDWEMERSRPSQEMLILLDQLEQQQEACCSGLAQQAKMEAFMKDHGLDQISYRDMSEFENEYS